jgi:hypothetical protein
MEEFESWLMDLGTVVLTDELKRDILDEVTKVYYRANVKGFEDARDVTLKTLDKYI